MSRLTVALLLVAPAAQGFERVLAAYPDSQYPIGVANVTTTTELSLYAETGHTYQVRVTSATPTGSCPAFPVMHLVDRSTGEGIVSSDSCASPLSPYPCLTYTHPGPTRSLTVVIHAAFTCATSEGNFEVIETGEDPIHYFGYFGGQVLHSFSDDIGWGAGDSVTAQRVMGHSIPSLYLVRGVCPPGPSAAATGTRLLHMGTPFMAFDVRATADEHSSAHCGVSLVVGTTAYVETPQRVRVLVNDAEDSDGDGVGDALEAALLTCPSGPGTNPCGCASPTCSGPYDPPPGERPTSLDSDRDGIKDGVETFGLPDATWPQPLPFLGADPATKDVFLEVDWFVQDPGDPSPQPASAGPLSPDFVLAARDAFLGEGTTRGIRNPSGKDGVRVHVDVGCAGALFLCPYSGNTTWGYWGGATATSTQVWRESRDLDLSPERKGIFRHAIMVDPLDDDAAGRVSGPGAFLEPPSDAGTVTHELGHLVGLKHHGDPADALALNCKVNYGSSMSYSYRGPLRFSNGYRPGLNSSQMNEGLGIGPDVPGEATAAELLEDRDHLVLPGGPSGHQVDWDDDGVISPSVRASPRWPAPEAGQGCDIPDVHSQILSWPTEGTFVPAAVSLTVGSSPLLFTAFVSTEYTLGVRVGVPNLVACDESGMPQGCCSTSELESGCTTWGDSYTIAGTENMSSSPTIAPLSEGCNLLVYTRGTGSARTVYVRRLCSVAPPLGPEVAVPGLSLIDSTLGPSEFAQWVRDISAVQIGDVIELHYLGPDFVVRVARLDAETLEPLWCRPEGCDLPVAGDASVPPAPLRAWVSPVAVLVDPELPHSGGIEILFGLPADPDPVTGALTSTPLSLQYAVDISDLTALLPSAFPVVCASDQDCADGTGGCVANTCVYRLALPQGAAGTETPLAGPPSVTQFPGSPRVDVWFTDLVDGRVHRAWQTVVMPSAGVRVAHQSRVFGVGVDQPSQGVATTWHGQHLQLLFPRDDGANMYYAPFADGVFGVWEYDNPDFWTIHRFMCWKLAGEGEDVSHCGDVPLGSGGQPADLSDQPCDGRL